MARQELYVAQLSTGIVNQPGSSGDEGSPARMGRTALQTDGLVGFGEPIDDADRAHRAAALGTNDRSYRLVLAAQLRQGVSQFGVDWDQPPARFLGGAVVEFDG